jgi:hypothetical protein
MKKPLYIAAMSSLLLASILLVYVFYLLFYPFKVIDYYNQPFPVTRSSKAYAPGEVVEVMINYCRYIDTPALVNKRLIDHVDIPLPSHTGTFGMGCHEIISANTVIPEYVPPGQYYIDYTVEFKINALRTVTVETRTEPFYVVSRS